jgi:hypothetical protein
VGSGGGRAGQRLADVEKLGLASKEPRQRSQSGIGQIRACPGQWDSAAQLSREAIGAFCRNRSCSTSAAAERRRFCLAGRRGSVTDPYPRPARHHRRATVSGDYSRTWNWVITVLSGDQDVAILVFTSSTSVVSQGQDAATWPSSGNRRHGRGSQILGDGFNSFPRRSTGCSACARRVARVHLGELAEANVALYGRTASR